MRYYSIINEKLTSFIEQTYDRDCSLCLPCNEKRAFLFLKYLINIICCHVRELMLFFIPVGTNYALLQTCIYFVIRETSGCVFLTINKQMTAKD